MQKVAQWVYRYGEKCAGKVSFRTTHEAHVPVALQKRVTKELQKNK